MGQLEEDTPVRAIRKFTGFTDAASPAAAHRETRTKADATLANFEILIDTSPSRLILEITRVKAHGISSVKLQAIKTSNGVERI
jgi:hypothetical protein